MKKVLFYLFMGFCIAVVLISCAQSPGVASEPEKADSVKAGGMSIDFKWARENLCERGFSPEITVSGIPEGTARFKVRLRDLNMTSYNHGGGEVENDGSGIIRAGDLKDYRGPCPPMGDTHRYSFTVQALDAAGKMLAKAEKTVPCNRAMMKD